MKKFLIIFIPILLIFSSFACGFFVKKHEYDKNIALLSNKNIQLEKDNKNLQKTADKYKTFISDNWEKVTDDIYLDKKSIKRKKKEISAWFKKFHSEDTYIYHIDGIPVYYDLIEYDADCKSDALHTGDEKQFDKNGNLLADYPSESDVCADYSAYKDGETVYRALCKYKK